MCRLLRQRGFETVPFETARLKKHGNFDEAFCIVLDINLNDGSGIELRHQLAESGVNVPVIYVTGNDSDATRVSLSTSSDLTCHLFMSRLIGIAAP